MEEEKKGVQEASPAPNEPAKDVEPGAEEVDDKDKNFAKLRETNKNLQEENERLKKEARERDNTLDPKDEQDPEDPKDNKEPSAAEIIFGNNRKEAARDWNKKNDVSKEEWEAIQERVVLKGDETQGEIYDKIEEAYNNLPAVRERKEKELVEKGRKEAMREYQDDELDIAGGGDPDLGGNPAPRVNKKTRTWAKGLGLSEKELKNVDMDKDPSGWDTLDPDYKD